MALNTGTGDRKTLIRNQGPRVTEKNSPRVAPSHCNVGWRGDSPEKGGGGWTMEENLLGNSGKTVVCPELSELSRLQGSYVLGNMLVSVNKELKPTD